MAFGPELLCVSGYLRKAQEGVIVVGLVGQMTCDVLDLSCYGCVFDCDGFSDQQTACFFFCERVGTIRSGKLYVSYGTVIRKKISGNFCFRPTGVGIPSLGDDRIRQCDFQFRIKFRRQGAKFGL